MGTLTGADTGRTEAGGSAAAYALSAATGRRGFNGFSLRQRVALVAVGAVVLATLASTLASRAFTTTQLLEAQQDQAAAVAQGLVVQLQRILAMGLRVDEVQGFDAQCREVLAAHDDVAYVAVLLPDGTPLAGQGRDGTALPATAVLAKALGPGWTLETSAAPATPAPPARRSATLPDGSHAVATAVLDLAGSPVAQVVVGFPQALLDEAAARLLRAHLAAGGAALAATLLLLWWALSRWVTRPLARCVARMNDIDPRAPAAARLQATAAPPGPPDPDLAAIDDAVARLLARLAEHEAELVTTRDQALEASRLKSEFLSVVSHEVRTPLNAVLGMAQLLQTTALDARQQQWLGHLRQGGETLLSMVTDILDLASIEAGRLRLVEVPTDLHDLVRSVCALHAPLALAKGLTLTVQADERLRDAALVDPQRLRQVLGNLLSNAVKFTAHGDVGVHAELEPGTGRWTLTVSDSGPGIPPAFLPHLYEAFRQGHEDRGRRHGGTGLGLAIVQRLVVAMGGDIDHQARPARGATFVVRLPWRAAPAAPAPVARLSSSGSPAP